LDPEISPPPLNTKRLASRACEICRSRRFKRHYPTSEESLFDVLGEARVNVLELNLALDSPAK